MDQERVEVFMKGCTPGQDVLVICMGGMLRYPDPLPCRWLRRVSELALQIWDDNGHGLMHQQKCLAREIRVRALELDYLVLTPKLSSY